MRMWMVDPRIMCQQHLVGQHHELHMIAGCLAKGRSLRGYMQKGLIEPTNLIKRHNTLVEEMISRKYNHKTPLNFETPKSEISVDELLAHVDKEESLRELLSRCPKCTKRYEELKHGTQTSN